MAGVALTDGQAAVLARIAAGVVADQVTVPERLSARALVSRRLVKISGRGPTWSASLTPAGEHYAQTGEYPEGHWGTPKASAASPRPTASAQKGEKPKPPEPQDPVASDWPVDSPRGKRERGHHPRGDSLFNESSPDPWDERILVSVAEAAWSLSLTENAIRAAVRHGDLDRVFIGSGRTHYRIVWGSLLAWVNDMPREATDQSWWSPGRAQGVMPVLRERVTTGPRKHWQR